MTPDEIWNSLDTKLVAILRGIAPHEVDATVRGLIEVGFRAIEIPLNSPDVFRSIKLASAAAANLGGGCLIGAGTVTTPSEVQRVVEAGGNIVVSPNVDEEVIEATLDAGMLSMPGILSPSEAISAIQAGARHLKVFPASTIGVSGMKALRAVLPKHVSLAAVGGVGNTDFEAYLSAGIESFGLGSSLYKPGMKVDEVLHQAKVAISSYRKAKSSLN